MVDGSGGDFAAEPGIRDLDARSLRGVAHPMRVRILSELALRGPATATVLADRFGVRSGSTSWHLQKLAEHGFIEEVPELGTPRERWWQVLTPRWSVDAGTFMAGEGELAEATQVVLSSVIAQHLAGATQFIYGEWSREWREAFILSAEDTLQLSPQLLIEMRQELVSVLRRYRDRGTDADDAESIRFQMQGFPYRAGSDAPE